MPSCCTVCTTGQAAAWPNGYHRGELPLQWHERLDDQGPGTGQIRCHRRQRVGRVENPDPSAVIPAASGLQDDRPTVLGSERRDRRDEVAAWIYHRVGRYRQAQLGEPGPHQRLVLRELERIRSGMDRMTIGDEGADVLAGHVLVIEGDDVTALGEAAQRGKIGVLADHHIWGDERGAVVGGDRQHAQGLAECDAGLVRHPRQLPAADHPHPGHAGARVHGAKS